MNNKKNKRKQNRKILPLILAIIALVSMLAVSASAADLDCKCYSSDAMGFSFYASEVTDYWILECDDCHTLRYFYGAGSFARFEGFEVGDGPFWDGVNESLSVGLCGEVNGEGTCVDFGGVLVDGLPSNSPADNNGGLVQTIIRDITNAISVFMQNMGRTLVDFFDNVVVKEGKLTTFATWTLVFVGIGFGSKFVGKLMRKAD